MQSMPRLRRKKVFGPGRAIPLDRNAKVRVMAYARAWSARHRQDRQHRGPLTRAYLEVLQTLLWGFHNSRSGVCFPSYESIAERADCARSTVAEALKALEFAGALTWQHRIARIRERCQDLFGHDGWRWRVIRTSNAYAFRDPQPQLAGIPASKSGNPTGTLFQESFISTRATTAAARPDRLLARTGAGRPQPPVRTVAEQLALLAGQIPTNPTGSDAW